MSETPANTTIELNAPRTIALQGAKQSYILQTRRLTSTDWGLFFGLLFRSVKNTPTETVQTVDYETAQLALAEQVLVHADGYKVKGDTPLEQMPHWQRMIPAEHRMAVVSVLASTLPADAGDELELALEGETVSLSAIWSANADGTMSRVSGLKHTLAAPTEAQYRRYKREANRTRVIGGRNGETIFPQPQMTLAGLYDELIVAVDGYTVDGVVLTGRANIAREMDTHHKVIAAQQIFEARMQVSLKTTTDSTPEEEAAA